MSKVVIKNRNKLLFVLLTLSSVFPTSFDWIDISFFCISLGLALAGILKNDNVYFKMLFVFLVGAYISMWAPHTCTYKGGDSYTYFDYENGNSYTICLVPYVGLTCLVSSLIWAFYSINKKISIKVLLLCLLGVILFSVFYKHELWRFDVAI